MVDYQLVLYPATILKKKLQPYLITDKLDFDALVSQMFHIMYQHNGIGLSANQVGADRRIFVMDIPEARQLEDSEDEEAESLTSADDLSQRSEHQVDNQTEKKPRQPHNPKIFINPEILSATENILSTEGCLSVPGITVEIKRFNRIKVGYLDSKFTPCEEELENLMAICFQHELDHLNGKLFWDHLPPLQRNILKKKFKKQQTANDKF